MYRLLALSSSKISILIIGLLLFPFFSQAAHGKWNNKSHRYNGNHHYQQSNHHRIEKSHKGQFSFSYSSPNYYFHSDVGYPRHRYGYKEYYSPSHRNLHTLPFGYRKVHIGGRHYYYANGIYYDWHVGYRAYIVIDNPYRRKELTTASLAGPKELFVYPNQGQSAKQTSMDRYECYLWSVEQTGFDPGEGLMSNSDDYQRAMGFIVPFPMCCLAEKWKK